MAEEEPSGLNDALSVRSKGTYADLTEVFMFPSLTEVIGKGLQKRLGLLYTPVIRRLCDLGGKWE